MKVRVTLEVTDEQRRKIAAKSDQRTPDDGRNVARLEDCLGRLATRAEVAALASALVDLYAEPRVLPEP